MNTPTGSDDDRINAEIRRKSLTSSDPFAAAVRATRMPMIITDPWDHDNPIIFVNDAFLKLTGYSREEITGNNCRFLQGEETKKADVLRVREAIAKRVPIELDLINYKKSGERFWNRLLISPVFNEAGDLTYFFASQFDVTIQKERLVEVESDRARLEKAVERRTSELTQSEDQLRYILKSGNLGYWTLDLSDMRLIASDICKENFGRPVGEPFSYEDLVASVFEDDRERMQAAVADSIRNRTDYNIEYRLVTPEGEVRWISVRGRTSYSADGTPLSMAGVSSDITDRKRNEQHREFLTAELNHRVKNSMVTMQSIAHQTLRNASTVEQAREDLDARLQSLASAHDVLTRDRWHGASLTEIVTGALAPFVSSQDRLKIDGPPVWLPSQMSLAMVMAVHELATNAVKYGALSNNDGCVSFSWRITKSEDGPHLHIRWEENGGPTVTAPKRRGFGSRMIERVLSAEFGGTSRLDYRPQGLVFEIDSPLPVRGANS